MDTNNQEFYEDEEVQEIPVRKKKKKKVMPTPHFSKKSTKK